MDDYRWADVVVGVQQSHVAAAREALTDTSTTRIELCKLVDPAFRKTTEWPDLAATVVAAASRLVDALGRPAQ